MSDKTIKSAVLALNPKIVLTYFIVAIAAMLVVFLSILLYKSFSDGKSSLDAGTVAVLAGFVTLFLKMASDAVGYHFGSSASSDKKDDAIADIAKAPAVITAPPTSIFSPPLAMKNGSTIVTLSDAMAFATNYTPASADSATRRDVLMKTIANGGTDAAKADAFKTWAAGEGLLA